MQTPNAIAGLILILSLLGGTATAQTVFVQGDEEGLLTRLLATHPPMDERIARLEALEADRWHEIEIE